MGKASGASHLQKMLRKMVLPFEAIVLECISYEEAMRYFIAHKEDDPQIVKGALLYEGVEDGYTVLTQLFLDKESDLIGKDNGTPLGRRVKTLGLDDELLGAFRQNNLIIVE